MTRYSVIFLLTACGPGNAETPVTSPDPELPAEGAERADGAEKHTRSAGDTVNIFLAAGEPKGDMSCHFSKRASSAESCEIHRMRWDLDARRLVDHQIVLGGGHQGWMPSISPDGSRIAYASKDGRSVNAFVKEVDAPASDPGTRLLIPEMGRTPMWTFPHWLSNDAVMLSHPDRGVQCVSTRDGTCQRVERWNDVWSVTVDGTRPVKAEPLLGVGNTAPFAVQDTWVNPVNPNLVAAHGQRAPDGTNPNVCSAGKGVPCEQMVTSPYPFVFDLESGKWWAFQIRTTEPRFRKDDGSPLDLKGCAHLAWSPDGTELLCTEQSTMEIYEARLSARLFRISFDPKTDPPGKLLVRDMEPMFAHTKPEDLVDLKPGETCDVFYHKYAEYCGDKDHVVASITCDCHSEACGGTGRMEPHKGNRGRQAGPAARPGGRQGGMGRQRPGGRRGGGGGGGPSQGGKLIKAHVYMIDISNPRSPVYTDLTAQIEEHLGLGSGGLRSFTATCSTAD